MKIKTGYVFGEAAKWWYLFLIAGLCTCTIPLFYQLEVEPFVAYVFGSGMLLLALILRQNWYFLEIDGNRKRYRKGVAVFGFSTGTWSELPPISSIRETSANVRSWNTPNGITPTFMSNRQLFTIGLFEDETLHLFVQTAHEPSARKWSAKIRETLQLPG